MKIKVYLDDNPDPLQELTPPEKFEFDSEHIEDGPHQLTFKAIDDENNASTRVIAFTVQNGPAIAVHGVVEGDQISGKISVLANAYGSKVDDEFEPFRMETPAPVPTWAWVLVLIVFAWGAGYISSEIHLRDGGASIATAKPPSNNEPAAEATDIQQDAGWAKLGEQVYGNNCASCHQITGGGMVSVFPPLVGNAAVLDDDASAHIQSILNGLSGKTIDGIAYASPMPAFASILSDDEIAAVVNHERSSWGNSARTVTADEISKLR